MTTAPVKAPVQPAFVRRVLPVFLFASAGGLVISYIHNQLSRSRNVMDSRFAQYNSPQSEARRRKDFEGAVEDPRKSAFNVLGW